MEGKQGVWEMCKWRMKSKKSRFLLHFHIFHNACTLFTPPNFAQPLFSISLGTTAIPRRNENKGHAKSSGGNKVHYGKCGGAYITFFFLKKASLPSSS